MAEESKKKKGGNGFKILLVLLIFFIIIPAAALSGFYFMNDTFKYRLNAALSSAPVMGDYFASLPTKAEIESQIDSIAEYFLEISADRAVDKLILIKSDEHSLYNDIQKVMLKKDPNATKVILEGIREKERVGDAISTTLDEIMNERSSELSEIATELQSIPFSSLREELYKIINDGLNGNTRLASILEQMDSLKAFELLSLIDEVDRDNVLQAMDPSARALIYQEMSTDQSNTQKLISLSEIYASKEATELVDLLSNTSTYSVDELAIIFKEIGILKTGEILAKAEDDNFVNEIITEMKNNEVLASGEDNITKDITKSLNIYKKFDDNILQLTNIYSTMQSQEVATLLKGLITNGALPQVYVLDSGDVITITDEDLAYRVLENFDDKTIAEIIGYFEDSLAAEVSKKLTIPEY